MTWLEFLALYHEGGDQNLQFHLFKYRFPSVHRCCVIIIRSHCLLKRQLCKTSEKTLGHVDIEGDLENEEKASGSFFEHFKRTKWHCPEIVFNSKWPLLLGMPVQYG